MGKNIFFLLVFLVILFFWNRSPQQYGPAPVLLKEKQEELKIHPKESSLSQKSSGREIPKAPVQLHTSPSQRNKENYVLQDEKGNIHITHVIVEDDYLISHGDIIVEDRDNLDLYKYGRNPLAIPRVRLWPKGIIPVVIEKDLTQKDLIETILNHMESITPLSFPLKRRHRNFVRFKKGSRHCYSRVGMKGGGQDISLSPRCRKKEIIHEIMHAIGFFHEQNRPGRDDFVQILWENIDEEHHSQFKKIETKLWEKTVFPFSFKSIMLYSSRTFASEGYSMLSLDGEPFESASFLSREDIRRINFLYGKSPSL